MMNLEKSIQVNSSSREALWDNVKFTMIILMVIGHFADPFVAKSDVCKSIFLFVYAFHMPVFIFISGLFYNEKDCKRKFLYYAICGFAYKICYSIVNFIIYRSTVFSFFSDEGIPWFMFAIAAYQVLMILIKNINKRFLFVFSIFVACFIGYDKTIGDFLYISRIVVFFPFFLLGTAFNHIKIINFIKRFYKYLLPISIIVILIWFYLCFFRLKDFYFLRPLFTGRNPFSEYTVGLGPLVRLLCYLITFLTGFSIFVIVPECRIPILTYLGSRTLNVYFWHWPIYLLLDYITGINRLFDISILGKVAYLLIAVILSIVLMAVDFFDYPLVLIKKYCFEKSS